MPCLDEIKIINNTIERIIPAQWTQLPDGVFESSINTKSKFRASDLKLDGQWNMRVPTTKIMTNLEFEQKIDKVLAQKTIKTIYSNAFYQDICNIALVIVNIIILGHLLWSNIKIRIMLNKLEVKDKQRKTRDIEHSVKKVFENSNRV